MSRPRAWSTLVAFSVAASLMIVTSGPAVATDGEADDRATYSACVGPATKPVRFEDVWSGGSAERAIDCMLHYGIMGPTSDGRFSPKLGVTRREMALFLVRAAVPAGIELPRVVDSRFEDIDGLPREVRLAINQLVELEIVKGTTRSTFSPDRVVTRQQMAQFLGRFLDAAPVGEGGIDINDVDPDDEEFRDIDHLPHDPYDAIRALYEMGITQGMSRTMYGPDEPVTRSQMALFISRMLAHTNARPAGITIQAEQSTVTAGDTIDLVVSAREQDHRAIQDTSVDLFSAPSREAAFNSAGACTSKVTAEFGSSDCVIDFSDETTDGLGNVFYTVTVTDDMVLWAWIGDRGERFDDDRDDSASVELRAKKAATKLVVTDNLPEHARKVPFGTWVTLTFQVADEDGKPVAEKGIEFRVRAIQRNDGRVVRDRTDTYSTDSSGEVELRFRNSDPSASSDDPDGTLDLNVERTDLPIDDETAVRVTTGPLLQWSDDDDEPSVLLLEQPSSYSTPTGSGRGRRNTVTATLLDQYGDPVRGERIHFLSNDVDGLSYYRAGESDEDPSRAQSPYRKTTSRRGTASIDYYRDSDLPAVETITAFVDDGATPSTDLDHYWIAETPDGQTVDNLEVLQYGKDDNTLVIACRASQIPASTHCDFDLPSDAVGVYALSFDSNDQFNTTNNQGTVAETYADFREGLAEGDTLTVDVHASGRGSVDVFTRTIPDPTD